ncbi:hypothetical protein NBRC10513v2_000180 [Rhodotorula toruloides]
MAPAPSLLPVRKGQAGISALPRLKSAQPLSSVQPPQRLSRHDNTTLAGPTKTATALEDADVTVFGWGDLLGGGDESGADGLLSEGASWLLDRTDFTIAGQTLAEDQMQFVDGDGIAVAGLEEGASEEDEVILAQVGGQELSSDRGQVTLERSASQTSHKPTTSSPASAAVNSGKLTTAPFCARSSPLESTAPTPPRTISELAHPTATETLIPHSLRSADPIAKQAEDVQPAVLRTLTPALPLEPPPSSRNEQSASAHNPSDLSPFNSPPRNSVPPPAPVMNAVTRPLTLTRPAHILPKNHPGHRRSVAAAISVPAGPSGQPKKRPEEKGIKPADDAIKRKVREAKVEREKKAKERRDKAEEEAANRAAARKQELARERNKKEEKREVVASRARRDDVAETGKTTARSETKQTTSRGLEQRGPHPAPFLEPIAAPPTLAFDADLSLPAMGAALDFPREVGAHGGVFDASTRITSTPARPQKRPRLAEEPAATHSATANSEAKEVKRARRTTAAMPPRDTVEVVKEEEEAEEEQLPTSALRAEPRRRHDADGAAVPTDQTVSAPKQRRRSASSVSLAPVGVPDLQLSPDGAHDAQHTVHELLIPPKASMSRRASRVPAIVESSAASVDQPAPLPRDGDARQTPDARTAAAKPDPFSLPPADPLLRQRQRPAQTLGGVTLPASFSFAAPNTDPTSFGGEALERATRKSGPRSDPMRRVSRFLEGIAEASKTDEVGVGDEPGGDALRAGLDGPAIGPSAPPTAEAAPLDAFALTVAPAPASASVPPAPSASSAQAVMAAPRRRASRAPLSAVIVNNGAQAASPAFVERLSSWKARESQSLHKTAGRATSVRAALVGARPAPDKENAPAAAATGSGRRIVAEKGVAAAVEKQIRERLEWSERQKKREEEVRRKREQLREEEAARERDKLDQLRASLAARDMRPLAKSALRRTARS